LFAGGNLAAFAWNRLMTGYLIVTDEAATRVITMRRPEKKNAITEEMYRSMSDAIDTAQNNPNIRCLIITGGSGVFTAGNDVEDFLKHGAGAGNSDAVRTSAAVKFLYSLAHNVKPVIAAVDGVAIGIGTTMLFHCDYVLASNTATFSTPFIHLGLVPEGASSLLMPRTMGHQRAFEMLVMGRTMDAGDARVAGFVNAVVAPGHTEAEARKVAREICTLPAEAVAIARKLIRLPPEDMTRRIDQESHLFSERMRSTEAVAAFKSFFARKGKG
jgi:enoyl-CoA hydratase/carnithine racemase